MIIIGKLLELCEKAAREAGAAIMQIYASGDFGVEMKSDQSPLTLADKAAHDIIAGHLQETGLPMLSEEGSNIAYAARKQWEYYWLIDPLDGTKEFIKKTGEFTVNIALMYSSVPVAGVIYAPCIDVMYYGSGETGAYKNDKGAVRQLAYNAKRAKIDALLNLEKIRVVASKSHMNEETSAFISQFREADLLSIGSSLKLMLLAEGAADIYPRLGPTMEWDTGAGHAILKSVNRGVYLTDLKSELRYNKEDLLNSFFVAF